MDGDIRQARGPKARLAELIAQARRAGKDAHGEALSAYVRQFGGRRPSYEERCEADPMETWGEAANVWIGAADCSERGCPWCTPRLYQRLCQAFCAGWQDGADSI